MASTGGLVEEVDPLHRVHGMRGVQRDQAVVVPQHRALLRDDELQVRIAGEVGLEDVPRPRLTDPCVPVLERLDVALVVVLAHDPRVALLREEVRSAVPVVRGRLRLIVDSEREHADRAELGVVGHHPDLSLEGRIPEVLDAGDLAPRHAGVIGDPREPRLPGGAVAVARVKRRIARDRSGVPVKVGHPRLIEGDQPAVLDQLRQLPSVADHDQVVADRLPGGEHRADLCEEARVVLDHRPVVDADPRLFREQVDGRVVAAVGAVDVQRPVGPIEDPGLVLLRPEHGPVDVLRAGAPGAGDPAGVQEAHEARSGHPRPGCTEQLSAREARLSDTPQKRRIDVIVHDRLSDD